MIQNHRNRRSVTDSFPPIHLTSRKHLQRSTMMAARRPSVCSAALLFTYICGFLCLNTSSFQVVSCPAPRILRIQSSALSAKKSRRGVNKEAKTSGFGGKATEPCPCGSGLGYMKCCGLLHKDPKAFASATAEQVVRGRYSAYAKREV